MSNQSKNILVTGSNGQLGKCLHDAVQNSPNFFFTDIAELDITNINAVSDFVHKNRIDCIVNTAAYTAVDKAESEHGKAFDVNEYGVWVLSHICMEQNVFLIHVSTDYVFDGTISKPYQTNARTNPISVYGQSKLAGEKIIIEAQIPSIIIRTSWLYSKYGNNFLNTMLRLGKENADINIVNDQFGAPTNANDLSMVILHILEKTDEITKPTIFHYANEGVTTWYGFAKEIMEIAHLPCMVHPVATDQHLTSATRPAYSVFDLSKIKNQFNILIPNWVESLKLVING